MDGTVKLLLQCYKPTEIEIEARIKRQLVTPNSVSRLLAVAAVQWTRYDYAERKRISKSNRKCTYRQRNADVLCKSSIAREDINSTWCTIHVSTEVAIQSMLQSLAHVEPILVVRYRGEYKSHFIDVTEYDDEVLRVEIEVADSNSYDQDILLGVVSEVCKILQDSPIFLNFYDWKMVNHIAHAKFGPFCIHNEAYQKPVTMTMQHLKGLEKGEWVVTPKVDGLRRFLVVVHNRVFSVDLEGNVRYELLLLSDVGGTLVIDCEYAERYYVFDVPVFDGKYVGKQTLENRLGLIENVQELVSMRKGYFKFKTFDDIAKLYVDFSEKYKIDGMIFTHDSSEYIAPVFKWKMSSSVDLEVTANGMLRTCDGYAVKMPVKISPNEVVGPGVWEFQFDRETNALLPTRFRHDKKRANSMEIVGNNLFRAAPGTMFSGIGCVLMRKYHNRVKTRLIRSANDKRAAILDIGTGQGGDVAKWKRASFVYCVEPSHDAVAEMLERCRSINKPSITSLNVPLRDLDIGLIDHKIDIFIAFFCMNMFEKRDWTALEKVITNRGSKKCRFLAIAITTPQEHNSRCFTLHMKGNSAYNITIHGTRIKNVSEKAVDPSKLDKIMSKCGMSLQRRDALDSNTFMTADERLLSSMYELFVYKRS